MRISRILRVVAAAATVTALAVGASACSSSGGSGGGGANVAAPVTPDCTIQVSTDLSTKPVINIPSSCKTAPTSLVSKTIVKGNGPTVHIGQNVIAQYVGIAWSTKTQFDASWDDGKPFQFQIGVGAVVPGLDQALDDVQAGTRVLLVIPPSLGYGVAGQGPIGPDETLIFVIDVTNVQ